MKILSLLLLCLFSSHLSAQITLNRSHFPQSGDSMRVSNASPAGMADRVLTSGPNQNWDFRDLESNGQEFIYYQNSLQTPYFFYFFNTFGNKLVDSIDLVVTQLTLLYNFFGANNNKFSTRGLGFSVQGLPLPANYTDEDEIYHFPLTYGRKDSTTFAFAANIPTLGGYSNTGWRRTEVDGWGNIQTPYGSFDCLRLKSTVFTRDSLDIQGFNLGLPPRTTIEYKWLAREEKIPILEITGTQLVGTFTPTTVRYRDRIPAVVAPNAATASDLRTLQLYPVPANDKILLRKHPANQLQRILIFDSFGKMVYDENSFPEAGLDLSLWPDGVYVAHLITTELTLSRRFMVQHTR